MARLIACALGFGFANGDTGECRPGLATLAEDCATSPRTVDRCLGELQARGWIVRKGGNAPGIRAAIGFRFPGQHTPEMAREHTPEMATEHTPDLTGTHANPDAPPRPPYMEEPNLNHAKAPHPRALIRGLPKPQCTTTAVAPGSWAAERWDAWLQAEGFPPLERIGRKIAGGFEMPITVAPTKGEQVPYGIARRWADWLRSRA